MTSTTLNTNLTNTAVRSCLPTEATLEECVAHFAIASYAVEGNLREMARTAAKYIVHGAAPSTLELHANTKPLLRAAGLKYTIKWGVGYPHKDGSMHYWAGRKSTTCVTTATPKAPKWVDIKARHMSKGKGSANTAIEEIKALMDGFDWYYGFSDDTSVWKRWSKKQQEIVNACKKAGLSEQEMQSLQKENPGCGEQAAIFRY